MVTKIITEKIYILNSRLLYKVKISGCRELRLLVDYGPFAKVKVQIAPGLYAVRCYEIYVYSCTDNAM